MGKHHTKVAAALEFRQRTMPETKGDNRGFRKPGSMNPRKTGFFTRKSR